MHPISNRIQPAHVYMIEFNNCLSATHNPQRAHDSEKPLQMQGFFLPSSPSFRYISTTKSHENTPTIRK